jgi:hypothetical protein
MRDGVRVRRDWIDVRHEYLQADGRWMAGSCAKPGWCRDCNADGEGPPAEFMSIAFRAGQLQLRAARTIVAAHLHIPFNQAVDNRPLVATPFRRLWIAYHLQIIRGEEVDDEAALSAQTIGDMIALVLEPEEEPSS